MKRLLFVLLSFIMIFSSCQTSSQHEELAVAYYNLGNAYYELDKFNDAAEAYALAYHYNPELIRSAYNLARVYIEQKKYGDAINILLDLTGESPDDTLFLSTLAWTYYNTGDLEQSKNLYLTVLDYDSKNGNALYNLSLIAEIDEDLDNAIGYLKSYFEFNINDIEALGRISRMLSEKGEWQSLLTYAEYWRDQESDSVDALFYIAKSYKELERYDLAIDSFQTLLELSPEHAESFFELGYIYAFAVNDFDKALEFFTYAYDFGLTDEKKWEPLADIANELPESILTFLTENELINQE